MILQIQGFDIYMYLQLYIRSTSSILIETQEPSSQCHWSLDGAGRGEKALWALQPLTHWRYWTGKRGCIDFDLNWATFMVNFTRAASSSHQFTPRGNETPSPLEDLVQCEDQIHAPSLSRDMISSLQHTHAADLVLCEDLQWKYSRSVNVTTYSTYFATLILK